MARSSSDSDDYRRKKSGKSRGRYRSRSNSYDSSRHRKSRSSRRSPSSSSSEGQRSHSRSRDDKRHRRRSRSYDSHRPKRSYRRSRSRSRTPSRKHRASSRSRSREKKSKKQRRRRSRSPSPRKNISLSNAEMNKQVSGFSDMSLVDQGKARAKAAMKAIETSSSLKKNKEASKLPEESMTSAGNAVDQAEKDLILENLNDDDFMPTHFKSSRKKKKKEASQKSFTAWNTAVQTFAEQENSHEMAIFGNLTSKNVDEKTKSAPEPQNNFTFSKRSIRWEERDPKTLIHPDLNITQQEADRRWKNHLTTFIDAIATTSG